MATQKRQRRQRIISRMYRRHNRLNVAINNGVTLRRIASLPHQQITNNLLMFQFFNGFSF
jgi:hypothetical protein